MINKLFKPAWQHESPEKRIQAIRKLATNKELEETLDTIIAEDTELMVRQAALERITNPESVNTIAETHSDDPTRECAREIFCKLVGAETSLSAEQLSELSTKLPNCRNLIAAHAPYKDLRETLLAPLTQTELAEIVADLAYSDTRLVVADRLTEREALEIARKQLKGKDKSSEKVIKQKIDDINKQEQILADNEKLTDELCNKMDLLASHQDWREETKTQFLIVEQRWTALGFKPTEEAVTRFETARLKVTSDIDHNALLSNSYAKQEALTQELEESCLSISKMDLERLLQSKPFSAELLNSNSQQWTEQNKIVQHKLEISERFIESAKALEDILGLSQATWLSQEALSTGEAQKMKVAKKALEKELKSFHWPTRFSALSSLTLIGSLSEQLTTQLELQSSQATELLEKSHKRLNRILSSTQQGNLSRSRQELEKLKKTSLRFSGKDRKTLDDRIEKAEVAVKKMGDWKDFVTEPKLIELCDQMEKLVAQKNPNADKTAKKIKSLQDSWKSIGDSDISEQHWPRFKLAADAAYEPCAIAFKERREEQKLNLKKRIPYIHTLKGLVEETDWDATPDYPAIEGKIREVTNDWQKIKNVEQKGGQKQWNELNKLKDKLFEKLSIEYDRNIEQKTKLIQQLDSMDESNIEEASFAKLQLIQKKWKEVGITRRKQDQGAWRKFKKSSDRVYELIQSGRQQVRASENEHINQFRNNHKQIIELSKRCSDLAEGDKRLEELKIERQELPPLPKELAEKLQEGLDKDFTRACDAYDRTRDRLIGAKKNQKFDLVREAAKLCTELEAIPQSANESEVEELTAKIQSIEIEDRAIKQRLAERLSNARKPDRDEFTKARRMLCIEMEILLDLKSPTGDQSLRMQTQLKKMQDKGIGHSQVNINSVTKEMQLEWQCLPGAEAKQQVILDLRAEQIFNPSKKQKPN